MNRRVEIPPVSYDELFTSKGDEWFLGQGSFSVVYRCCHQSKGDVAVKILNAGTRHRIGSFNKEGQMHLLANKCEHILKLIGVAQKECFVGLVLECMPYGSVADILRNPNVVDIPWTFRLRALSEVASAVQYLHNLTERRKLVHCDLKVENILLNANLNAKIGDFGGADFSTFTGQTLTSTRRGTDGLKLDRERLQYTLSYAAPELITDLDKRRTTPMDVYSFGVVMYVMTARRNPFQGKEEAVIVHAVTTGQRPKANLEDVEDELTECQDEIGLQVFQLFHHLMQQCWKQCPSDRMKIENVCGSLTTKFKNIPVTVVQYDLSNLKQSIRCMAYERPEQTIPIIEKYNELVRRGTLGRETTPYEKTAEVHSGLVRATSSLPRPVSTENQTTARTATINPAPSGAASPNLYTGIATAIKHAPPRTASPYEVRTTSPDHGLYAGASGSTQRATRLQSHSEATFNPRPASPLRSLSTPSTAPKSPRTNNQIYDSAYDPSEASVTVPKRLSDLTISNASQQQALRFTSSDLQELEASFRDPYLRQGNAVIMITDLAAVKNAQVGHGGWHDKLLSLRDVQGSVRSVESNGDVTVDFSGVESHRFNPSSLTKLPSENDLSVGDFVTITLEKDVVKVMQENHGGWTEEMSNYFKMAGLVFRFLPDRDVLVVYKHGMYFRYNPEVLVKTKESLNVKLNDNPDIQIGDYVCHELELEVIKELQEHSGGWNDAMADLRGKVGKFVFADYLGRAFIAYGSKLCFVFNAAVLNKISEEEAVRRFKNSRDQVRRLAKERTENQTRRHRFAVDDKVRVRLPLDIVVELQRGNGGWCYQMLEVYGISGVVKEFDDGANAQVLFDTGNKWTFNPAALEKVPVDGNDSPPDYTPPFRIGDKVRVRLKDLNNESLNKMRQAFRMLDIPDDKAEILMKTGTVLGIDDDIDVIVSFGDGKNYGLKPEQLEKLQM